MKILTVGSLNVDNFYSVDTFVRPGESKHVDSLVIMSGGKGLNQSIACARAGLKVQHLGCVGSDGVFLRDELAQAGVKTGLIRGIDTPSGHTIIPVDDVGQNCILVYGGANTSLRLIDIRAAIDALDDDDAVLVQNETNLVAETIHAAYERGIRVAFNPSPITDSDTFPLQEVTWLFVKKIEGAALTGVDDPDEILAVFNRRFSHTEVILTLGERGSVWMNEGICERQQAYATHVEDSTAAGDTFTGYFLRGVLDGVEGVSPLMLASVASSVP